MSRPGHAIESLAALLGMAASTVLAAALPVVLMVALAGCGAGGGERNAAAIRQDGTVDLSKVTLRIGDQKAGARPVLKAAGLLDDVPYKIEWAQFTSGPPLLEAVNAGAVDVGRVGNSPPVFAAAAKSEITMIAGESAGTRGQAILVPKDSALRRPEELKGKRIAVAKGSSANAHLLSVLTKHGIAFDQVQVQYLQPADALAAFSEGRVDAWAIWDPYTAQAEVEHGARALVDGKGYTNALSFLVAGRQALEDKAVTAALRDYVDRYYKALVWADSHQREWAKVWSEETGIPLEATTKATERREAWPNTITDQVIASEQQIADAYAEAGLIPDAPVMADYADKRFAKPAPPREEQARKEQE